MATEIVLVKAMDGSLRPATAYDQEQVNKVKAGHGIKVKMVSVKPRSLEHHKLYFGGLLALALDYWEPKGGLISPAEIYTLNRFADWLDTHGGNTGAIRRAASEYLADLKNRRADKIEVPEKSIEDLHEWVKREAGYFTYCQTPSGLSKKTISINFNAMDQDQFMVFYKAAFAVVWKFILSRTFQDEVEVENTLNQLMAMG